MKSFTYRLEALLNLRQLERDESLRHFANAISERKIAENLVIDTKNKADSIQKLLREKSRGFFSADELYALHLSFDNMLEVLKEKKHNLSQKLSHENNLKKVFIEKDSALKSISRLREVKKEEHLSVERKKEDLELEDVINARFSYLQNQKTF